MTAATLYHLNDGGNLIDSPLPCLAIFGLAGLSEQRLAYGYGEFQLLKFRENVPVAYV